jgi:hypothetical protein
VVEREVTVIEDGVAVFDSPQYFDGSRT